MTNEELQKLVTEAQARYEAMTPEQKDWHNYEQRRSFVRGMCPWNRNYVEWCDMVNRIIPPAEKPE